MIKDQCIFCIVGRQQRNHRFSIQPLNPSASPPPFLSLNWSSEEQRVQQRFDEKLQCFLCCCYYHLSWSTMNMCMIQYSRRPAEGTKYCTITTMWWVFNCRDKHTTTTSSSLEFLLLIKPSLCNPLRFRENMEGGAAKKRKKKSNISETLVFV